MRKKLLASALPLMAIFNASAAHASSTYELEDADGHSVEVFEYSQGDAKQDHARVQVLLDSYNIDEENPDFYSIKSLFYKEVLQSRMTQHELSEPLQYHSTTILNQTYNSSYFDAAVTDFNNGSGPYSSLASITYNGNQLMPESCMINMLEEDKFDVDDLIYQFTYRMRQNDVEFPESFDTYFTDFVRFHEQAHCMMANETQADFIGSLQLFNKYGPEKFEEVKGFIELLAASRHYGRKIGLHPQYDGTGSAALKAIDYYQENADQLNENKIWHIATHNQYPELTLTADQERLARHRTNEYLSSVTDNTNAGRVQSAKAFLFKYKSAIFKGAIALLFINFVSNVMRRRRERIKNKPQTLKRKSMTSPS